MKDKEESQFNVMLSNSLIKQINIFTLNHGIKSVKEAAALLLEVGLEVCEEKMKKKKE